MCHCTRLFDPGRKPPRITAGPCLCAESKTAILDDHDLVLLASSPSASVICNLAHPGDDEAAPHPVSAMTAGIENIGLSVTQSEVQQ
jgi:hypothetical protein